MPIQIAFDYGIIRNFSNFFYDNIVFKGFQTINKSNNFDQDKLLNKSWLVSFFIIIVHHLTDITYYDGKISILIWLIMVGTKCIIDEKNESHSYRK